MTASRTISLQQGVCCEPASLHQIKFRPRITRIEGQRATAQNCDPAPVFPDMVKKWGLELAIRLLLTSLRPIAAKVASPNRHRPLRLGRGNWSSCPKCVIRDRSAEPPSRAESRPECLDPNWRRCAVPASVALRSRSRRFNVAQTGQTRDPAPKLPGIWRMSGYAFLALTEERRS